MNADILRQIVEELKEMPDESLNFNTWWCEEDGVITMCPIGNHITKHPELVFTLKVSSDAMSHKGHHKKIWDIDSFYLSEYLDISQPAVDMLFNSPWMTRDKFVELIDQFIGGEIDIRKCMSDDECGLIYVTNPENKACVCEDCKERLLRMCGI